MTMLTDIFAPHELVVISFVLFSVGCIGAGWTLGKLLDELFD